MRASSGAGVVLFLLALLPASLRSEGTTPQPRMDIPAPMFDFGDAAPGAALVHDFEIRNDGDADLLIDDVIAGCSCTTVTSDPAIKPGSSGRIRAVLDTSDLAGPLAKQIAIYTNDPLAPKSLLTLRATVRPRLAFSPESLRLEAVSSDPAVTAGATLSASDRDDLEVLSVETSEPALAVSFRPAVGAEIVPGGRGRQWRIEATLDPASPVGALAALVQVHTNHPSDGTLSIPVVGAQRLPLVLTPSRAALGDVRPGPGFRRILRLENLGVAPVEIAGVTSDLPALSAEVRTLPGGRVFEIALALDGTMPKGDFAGTLVIRTSSATVPRLDVQVSGKAL